MHFPYNSCMQGRWNLRSPPQRFLQISYLYSNQGEGDFDHHITTFPWNFKTVHRLCMYYAKNVKTLVANFVLSD